MGDKNGRRALENAHTDNGSAAWTRNGDSHLDATHRKSSGSRCNSLEHVVLGELAGETL